MAYKRQISYMDLIENEIKRGNAGFVKWEKYDECHILSVFINGVEGIYSKEANVLLQDGHSIGRININNGRAEGTYLLARGEKDWVENIGAIRIPIEAGKELVAEFEMPDKTLTDEMPTQEEYEAGKRPETFELAEIETEEAVEISEPMEAVESSYEVIAEELYMPEVEINDFMEYQRKEEPEKTQIQEPLSLWEKMQKTHELFYPFGNDVRCYRIFPKDISMLRARYHALRNNQFLMHGYYNYRHLIICPKKDSESEYWLGVPGIYHEREKMAARMFGFEKFEGTKKEYRTGDMGYYLITVE